MQFKEMFVTAVYVLFLLKHIFLTGFMKTVLKNGSRALIGRFFFSPETIFKGDDIKIKGR